MDHASHKPARERAMTISTRMADLPKCHRCGGHGVLFTPGRSYDPCPTCGGNVTVSEKQLEAMRAVVHAADSWRDYNSTDTVAKMCRAVDELRRVARALSRSGRVPKESK